MLRHCGGLIDMTETEARLNSHEAVCAQRYEQINARLKRMERVIMNAAGAMILSMAGVIFTFMTHAK